MICLLVRNTYYPFIAEAQTNLFGLYYFSINTNLMTDKKPET
ncbi:hypothetical protein J2S21_004406 [Peribacillus cavernae]|nr:hypothetical protein [Peribacillus cavernae]